MKKVLMLVSSKEEVDYFKKILYKNDISFIEYSNKIILESDREIKINKIKTKINKKEKDFEEILIYENIYMDRKNKRRFKKVLDNINNSKIERVYNNYTEYVLNQIQEILNKNKINDILKDIKKEA